MSAFLRDDDFCDRYCETQLHGKAEREDYLIPHKTKYDLETCVHQVRVRGQVQSWNCMQASTGILLIDLERTFCGEGISARGTNSVERTSPSGELRMKILDTNMRNNRSFLEPSFETAPYSDSKVCVNSSGDNALENRVTLDSRRVQSEKVSALNKVSLSRTYMTWRTHRRLSAAVPPQRPPLRLRPHLP